MTSRGPREAKAVLLGFLGQLSDRQRAALERRGQPRSYRTGAAVFHEGDPSEFAVVVLAGRLKVVRSSPEGHETVLAFRGPGDLVGELSLFDGALRSATLSAVEPVEALVITAERFDELLRDEPTIGAMLLRMVARRLREADRMRLEFGAYDTARRVARRIVELAEEHGSPQLNGSEGSRITLPISQTELAGWTGASREAVARALASLRRRGLITTDRRQIVVLDTAGLLAEAD